MYKGYIRRQITGIFGSHYLITIMPVFAPGKIRPKKENGNAVGAMGTRETERSEIASEGVELRG